MHLARFSKSLALALGMLVCSVSFAQNAREVPPFELEHLTFNPSQRASLLTQTGDLLPARQLRASLIIHYENNPLILAQVGGPNRAVVRNRVTAHLNAAFGITRWLEVGLQFPVVFQKGDTAPEIGNTASVALGTTTLQARVGLLSEERNHPLDLGFQLGVGLPWGNSAAYTRNASVSATPSLGAGKAFGIIRIGAEVSALLRKSTVLSPTTTTIGDEVGSTMLLGASATTTNKGLRGEVTVLGWIPFTRSPKAMELMLGARYPIGPIELYAMGGPGWGRSVGTPAYRFMLGAGLSIPKSMCKAGEPHEPKDCPQLDLDGDSVLNGDDKCPRDPGLPEFAGCMPVDTDSDGTMDPDDKCPTKAGPKENNGCPIAIVALDTDKDEIPDKDDDCPKEAGPKENKGCPWPDTDADTVFDKDDGCPKVAGPVENKGCPWPDTDGDTVVDPEDACPTEAGPVDRKGCPVKDTDGDGVPDEIDNCPKVKGIPENQGCPKKIKQLVVITKEKLVITEKVFFDTGKATIKPKSFPLLTQIAQVLTEHPEIAKIRIEGHTDNVGKDEMNRVLSLKRAESVRDFLVKMGVGKDRLEAQGFGPDRPNSLNDTPAGRENNRRVEFVIVAAEPKSDVHEVVP